jgi:hypothetical protein
MDYITSNIISRQPLRPLFKVKEGKKEEIKHTLHTNHISYFKQPKAAATGMNTTPPGTGEYSTPLMPGYANLIFNKIMPRGLLWQKTGMLQP